MNSPTPSIVPQHAVRRFPLWALCSLCLIYVVAGLVGRTPWKAADIIAFGYMLELTHSGVSPWLWPFLHPSIMGLPPEIDGGLVYGLGAWCIEVFTNQLHLLTADSAARTLFIALGGLTVVCTWSSVYFLALSPQAKPVEFAFGGQADPKDYALALADSSALALIATLGLAQLGHETTPTVGQLALSSVVMLGFSMMAFKPYQSQLVLAFGLFGLSLMGAPTLSVILGLSGALVCVLDKDSNSSKQHSFMLLILCLGVGVMAHLLHLWQWRVLPLSLILSELPSIGKLWLWFFWPVWPLMIWTLWRWRNQWASKHWSRHLIIPLLHSIVITTAAFITHSQERTLLLAMPPMAALAAFSLPTLKRSVKALIDWFTLLLFSGCAFLIWVIWIAYQTGWPTQPAKNVARLVPGFVSHFYLSSFIIAILATLGWIFIVHWRIGRNPAALWKSLILPAGGASLCWLLVMSLWLPPVDYGRGYVELARLVKENIGSNGCAYAWNLNRAEIIALQYHENLNLVDFRKSDRVLNALLDQVHEKTTSSDPQCKWILVNGEHKQEAQKILNQHQSGNWALYKAIRKPSDPDEDVVIFKHLQ